MRQRGVAQRDCHNSANARSLTCQHDPSNLSGRCIGKSLGLAKNLADIIYRATAGLVSAFPAEDNLTALGRLDAKSWRLSDRVYFSSLSCNAAPSAYIGLLEGAAPFNLGRDGRRGFGAE
jgi:hypothetical protein